MFSMRCKVLKVNLLSTRCIEEQFIRSAWDILGSHIIPFVTSRVVYTVVSTNLLAKLGSIIPHVCVSYQLVLCSRLRALRVRVRVCVSYFRHAPSFPKHFFSTAPLTVCDHGNEKSNRADHRNLLQWVTTIFPDRPQNNILTVPSQTTPRQPQTTPRQPPNKPQTYPKQQNNTQTTSKQIPNTTFPIGNLRIDVTVISVSEGSMCHSD